MNGDYLTIQEASEWARRFLSRDISSSNISYLVQYGKVKKYGENGSTLVSQDELKRYYQSFKGKRELMWKRALGEDINWSLSFDHLREKDTTKHVHRLHPYKGKFIPQLVEYFLDNHTDEFKKRTYFKEGDVILDPFVGCGTTLVQAKEMGMHSIGVDISTFNCMISEAKLVKYDFPVLKDEIEKIRKALTSYEYDQSIQAFENELYKELRNFNNKYFPGPEFKFQVYRRQIDEEKYAKEKEQEFLKTYQKLVATYGVTLNQEKKKTFLDRWYLKSVRREIDFTLDLVKQIEDIKTKKLLAILLSRTIRSCRATTHSDLATLKEPQLTTYYCYKHKKICKPLFSIKYWFNRYATDTLYRLREYEGLKKRAYSTLISADSRTVDIFKETKKNNPKFGDLLNKQKVKGIFCSPPYVGQIDYHEQHAYAYDLLGFDRKDDLEIGPLYKGQGGEARYSYIQGISNVLANCRKFLADDFDIFLVANDKHNLYPRIAEESNMKIVKQFRRPVLNRTERDRNPYSEIIFHLKAK